MHPTTIFDKGNETSSSILSKIYKQNSETTLLTIKRVKIRRKGNVKQTY